MPETHETLRSLFEEAAAAGQSHARTAPVARIAERGRRAHRWRLAALATCCLVLVGGTVATSVFLSTSAPAPVTPATGGTPPPAPASVPGTPPSDATESPARPSGDRTAGRTPTSAGTPTDSVPPGGATTTSPS
ncbi:hypothetical protein [Streptomyces griseus]|uniref:hypothetical protein n=1 Tax=Streptomyces griseus TaxID=1911 RepID=UPI0008405373|nr:hypothetical protein [Streptomyces griseus]